MDSSYPSTSKVLKSIFEDREFKNWNVIYNVIDTLLIWK